MNDKYPCITFNESGECSFCAEQIIYKPNGEEKLIAMLEDTKTKNTDFDARVP